MGKQSHQGAPGLDAREVFFWMLANNGAVNEPEPLCEQLLKRGLPPSIRRFEAEPCVERLQHKIEALVKTIPALSSQLREPVSEPTVRFLWLTIRAEDVQPVLEALAEVAHAAGLTMFDRTKGRYVRPTGPKYFEFADWYGDRSYDSSLDFILRRLEEVDTKLMMPFVVLSRPSGDFVQAMSTNGDYRVEWAETGMDGQRRQYVADKPDATRKRKMQIGSGKKQSVSESAVFGCEEAQAIFAAFYRGEPKPTTFVWHDMTDQL